jgi:hypothetical protein
MPKKPDLSASERISLSGLELQWPPGGGIITDPVDMDHIFDFDPAFALELTAIRLETRAQISEIMGRALAETAKAFRTRGRG